MTRGQETAAPQRSPRAREAKVILLCRSMGGLVVRLTDKATLAGSPRITRRVINPWTTRRCWARIVDEIVRQHRP
ncbi:hypothetical protein [Streptomyces sp. NPDC097610]|uniref:hypothetical protein n=1 Tax=Streptomyces sp. NPDC097610 TaxID=3157227 RepID=UPI00331CE18E